jgi:hypothetical protein
VSARACATSRAWGDANVVMVAFVQDAGFRV